MLKVKAKKFLLKLFSVWALFNKHKEKTMLFAAANNKRGTIKIFGGTTAKKMVAIPVKPFVFIKKPLVNPKAKPLVNTIAAIKGTPIIVNPMPNIIIASLKFDSKTEKKPL